MVHGAVLADLYHPSFLDFLNPPSRILLASSLRTIYSPPCWPKPRIQRLWTLLLNAHSTLEVGRDGSNPTAEFQVTRGRETLLRGVEVRAGPNFPRHMALSSSFLGLPYRVLNINHKKELLRGLLGSGSKGARRSHESFFACRWHSLGPSRQDSGLSPGQVEVCLRSGSFAYRA